MRTILWAALSLAGTASVAGAAEPVLPRVEWLASADTVASRVGEIVDYGKAHGDDDGKLADAVGSLKDKMAGKKMAPAWSKKSSWIEGKAPDQVYFGVGVFTGTTANRTLAFAVAENRARVEIAKLLKVTIARKSEANGWRSITVTSNATLAHVVIVDWYASGTTIYALASYSKPVAIAPDAPWVP